MSRTCFRYRPTEANTWPMPSTYRPTPRLRRVKNKWLDQVMRNFELSFAARVLGYVLADHTTLRDTAREFEKSGFLEIYCSQHRLAQKSGASERTVSTAISELIKQRHLHKLRRGRPTKGANRYLLLVDRAENPSKDLEADFSG
jgi:hypothetical protein